jgi:itaconyl-CoA hydratase
MALTGNQNYFEDFRVGNVFEHPRGRTVTHLDNYLVTHMSMNTAEAHFNLEYMTQMMGGIYRERLVVGPCTIAIVVGLTSEDMSENAFMDLGLTAIKLPNPVFDGDTLYARSEVLETRESDARPDAGIVRYRFTGRNGGGATVVEGERTILVKKRAHWAQRDGNKAD